MRWASMTACSTSRPTISRPENGTPVKDELCITDLRWETLDARLVVAMADGRATEGNCHELISLTTLSHARERYDASLTDELRSYANLGKARLQAERRSISSRFDHCAELFPLPKHGSVPANRRPILAL